MADSLRESLEKAFDDSNEQPSGQESAAVSSEPSSEPPGSSAAQPGQAGEGAPGQDGPGTPGGEQPRRLDGSGPPEPSLAPAGAQGAAPAPQQAKPGDQPVDPQVQSGQAEGSSVKAPQSWRPEIREQWGKIPGEVQQEILRREQQVSRALSDASRYVSHYNQFNELCAPYASMIAMDGGNPLNTFKEYLRTAATLRLGAPREKATAIANAVMQFGIDVQELDTALSGMVNGQPGQPGQQPRGQPQQQFRDPRLDQLLGQLEQHRQTRNQEIEQAQQAEIDNFTSDPKNEFFDDVRGTVANILEVYANQGMRCSLKEAYDKACLLDPRISQVIAARRQAAANNSLVQQNNASLAAKRRAAIMPPGSPNIGPGDGNGSLSLRDTIDAAMRQVESRV
jgi:hypothetical protein